jgi:hypothetical protein
MRPILPTGFPLVNKSKVGLVNQRGGLKGVVGALASQAAGGEPAEFLVNERY